MDNAEPSTNGIAASNLNRLSSLLDDSNYATLAMKTVQAFEAEMMQHPFLFVTLLDSVVMGRLGVKGVVITGEGTDVEEAVEKMRSDSGGSQFRTLARLGGSSKSDWLRSRNPLLKAMSPERKGVQVCEGGVCTETLELGEVEKVSETPTLET